MNLRSTEFRLESSDNNSLPFSGSFNLKSSNYFTNMNELNLPATLGDSRITMAIVQMGKLRHRDGKRLAPAHTTKWQSQEQNPGLQTPNPVPELQDLAFSLLSA